MDDHSSQRVTVWRIVGWVVTLIAIGFVIRWLWQLDRSVWHSLRHLKPSWLIGSIAVFQVWFLMRFMAWEMIVKRHGSETQRHQTLRNWTLSELARYVPGNIWSFAAKYRSSVTGGATRVAALQALVIEAVSLLAGAAVPAALFLNPQDLWWVSVLVVVLFPILVPIALGFLSRWKHWGQAPHISMTESLSLLLWYAAVWIVFGLATGMIYHSFPGVPAISWVWLFGANIMAWLIGYISFITPMGLGVREVAFVKLAANIVPEAVASLIALVTRLWLVVSELVFLGLVLSWYAIKRKA